MHCFGLHCIALLHIALHCIALHCFALLRLALLCCFAFIFNLHCSIFDFPFSIFKFKIWELDLMILGQEPGHRGSRNNITLFVTNRIPVRDGKFRVQLPEWFFGARFSTHVMVSGAWVRDG